MQLSHPTPRPSRVWRRRFYRHGFLEADPARAGDQRRALQCRDLPDRHYSGEIGSPGDSPAKIDGRIQVPMRGSSQDDFFSGFFGGQGFGTTAKEMTVSTKPSKIEIKQLPKDGRPDDFSGAIGQFSLTRKRRRKRSTPGSRSRLPSRSRDAEILERSRRRL